MAKPLPSPRIQRLVEASRLWGRMKWVHPALADGRIDWDKALLDALPDIAAADQEAAYASALQKMLAHLGDDALRIGPALKGKWVEASKDLPLVEWLPGEVALLHAHRDLSSFLPGYGESLKAIKDLLLRAKGLVLDLRPAEAPFMGSEDFLKDLLSQLVHEPLDLPTQRVLYNHGYPPQTFATSGGYYKAWLTQAGSRLIPDPTGKSLPVAFIVNEWAPIPGAALAFQKAGLGYIVSEGQIRPSWVVPTEQMTLGRGLQVTFRVGDAIYPDGTFGLGADQVVAPSPKVGAGSPAAEAALALMGSGRKPGATIAWKPLPMVIRSTSEKAYLGMHFPDLPFRQLAVIRLWAVIDAFFPYKDLMDAPWDDVLTEFLVRMEQVRTAQDYALTLAEMAARLQDNHVWVSGHPQLLAWRGEARLPLEFWNVDGRVLVAGILDPMAAPNVRLWDEVTEIDGVSVTTLMNEKEPYLSSANPWSRDYYLARFLGWGSHHSEAKLTLRKEPGRFETVILKRSKDYPRSSLREWDMIGLKPDNIGYADLSRLQPDQVDELFEKVKDTRGLILDMRGYPNGTAWPMAPRLNVKGAAVGALFMPNIVAGDSSGEQGAPWMTFQQPLPKGDGKPLYRGTVVMLIDERTISQAEHTGLFFEAACGVTFIGSPSAGSNGDVTETVLPGGVTVRFTGQGVRHADGRQLQRVGLQPHIHVRPTVKGLQAGQDEVLERAIQFLTTGK